MYICIRRIICVCVCVCIYIYIYICLYHVTTGAGVRAEALRQARPHDVADQDVAGLLLLYHYY